MFDGVTWVSCPNCHWYVKPARGKYETECRCGLILTLEDAEKEEKGEIAQ